MSQTKLRTRLLEKGDAPPCLKTGHFCRECLGWRKMIHTARTNQQWRHYPFRCSATGLTMQIVVEPESSPTATDTSERQETA